MGLEAVVGEIRAKGQKEAENNPRADPEGSRIDPIREPGKGIGD